MSKATVRKGNALARYNGEWHRFSFREVEGNAPFVSFAGKVKGTPLLPTLSTAVYTGSPVLFIEEHAHGEDTDLWFDKNQKRLTTHEEATISLYDELDETLQAISVQRDAVEAYHHEASLFSSLQPPMVAVAKLYVSKGHKEFILWHCEKECSRFVVVRDGLVRHSFDYWAGLEQITNSATTIISELQQRLGSVITLPFYAVSLQAETEFPYKGYELLGIQAAPEVKGVEPLYHELYAASLYAENVLSFSRMEDQEAVASIEKAKRLVRKYVGVTIKITVVLILILALWLSGIFFWGKNLDKKRIPNKPHLEALEREQKEQAAVTKEYQQYQKYALWESAVTCFLNGFSKAIPKGAHATNLEITEIAKEKWIVTLEIQTSSTGHIPQVIANLEEIEGVKAVRMLYSERSRKDDKKSVRAQIEATLYHLQEEMSHGE